MPITGEHAYDFFNGILAQAIFATRALADGPHDFSVANFCSSLLVGKHAMSAFIVDIPVPSMGATVAEVLVVSLKTEIGFRVTKGQKLAELESDKSLFDYEAPADGLVLSLPIRPGEALKPGAIFMTLETSDESLRHLESRIDRPLAQSTAVESAAKPAWTPRASKLAREAGLNPSEMLGLQATGPGGRVSGDDVARWLAARKS